MIGALPPRPDGSSPQARFMQWVWDQLSAQSRPVEVSGYEVSRTTRGTIIRPPPASTMTVQQSASLATYTFSGLVAGTDIVTRAARYYAVCYPYDSITGWTGAYAGTAVNIALPWRLQPPKSVTPAGFTTPAAPTEFIINVGLVQYDYLNLISFQERKATALATGVVERQFITPSLNAWDLTDGIPPTVIEAVSQTTGINDANGKSISMIMAGEFAFAWDPASTL